MAKSSTRRVTIYINGKEVEASVKQIRAEIDRLVNEQNLLLASERCIGNAQRRAEPPTNTSAPARTQTPQSRSGLLRKKYYFCTVEPACMNHDRTYRPVRRVPAPRLRDANGSIRQAPRRFAGYAAIHPVPPLKGLPGTRATDVSYRALAPGGAGFCYRICAGTSESRPTAHYSLPTANSTYTFSAKEKDSETGYSYFGSRYYNSDLSIWLSVDPMADKYPSVSPYVYCADNPIVIKDPNGMEYNPVFSTEGKLLGTDKDGWVGTPVVMEEEQFEQGMDRHVGTDFEIGIPLDQYENGISISNNDWNKIEKESGKERLIPYVENKSSYDIFYKPEESSQALSIGPGKDLYASVDGIAAPHLHKGMVYKITDGIHVSVTNNGVDITKASGLIHRYGMSLFGGWKDESWHYSLTTDRFLISNLCDQQPYYMYKTPDHGWDELFSKSR